MPNGLFAEYSRVMEEAASDCSAYYIALDERFIETLVTSRVGDNPTTLTQPVLPAHV